jgi:hypothetical protein
MYIFIFYVLTHSFMKNEHFMDYAKKTKKTWRENAYFSTNFVTFT